MCSWKVALILTLCVFTNAKGQMDQVWRYYYPEFAGDASHNLYLRLENNNFVKNNEYFGNHTEGYTMMGYTIQPSLMYYAGSNLRIKAGVHIIYYSGLSEFTEVIPTLTIHTKLGDHLDLIMGGLKGDVHHRLIEPIFNPENQYTRPIENGFQFIYDNNKLWLDAWVDWEQFIIVGDDKPEKFTAGISAEYKLINTDTGWNLNIPGQLIATHLGGQISDFEEPMQSLANMVSGFKLNKNIGYGFIQRIGLSGYATWYQDLTEKSGLPFTAGHALYPVGEIGYKYGELMLGYWYGNNFVAPKGSTIFQSISDYKPGFYERERQLLTAKISFSKDFLHQIKFSAMLESYYDIPASQFDYAYGFNIVFTPNFFLKKVYFD